MTEKEKMLAGEVYSAVDPELIEELMATREKTFEYNSLRPSETQRMKEIIKELFGHVGDDNFLLNQPFRCDYGKQISIGKRFFANFNFTVLDEAPVSIGDDCFIGPNVSIYTACHSTDPVERNTRQEWAKPVTIGNNVWIGGSVTILPGVTIGDNVTIGAGSVVTRDIPSDIYDGEDDDECEDGDYDDYSSDQDEPTYDRYNGSYAQDEMGYSDDDIDTIFDGDPDAYWNID